ncbi:MAG: 3'-5' exonuclease [Polyangiaceae bacterium]|nr:3'-5' exonuclease [Polyangiaceae bacterium]
MTTGSSTRRRTSPLSASQRARLAGEPPAGSPWDLPIDEAPVVFVDLEMTGLDASVDRVIEVCMERVRGTVTEESLTTLVRPDDGRHGNEHIHHIGVADLADAPLFAAIADQVRAIIDGAVLVAHGASYDVAFIEAELARLGSPLSIPHHLDTLTLSRRVYGFRSHALGALCEELGISVTRCHRAADDVRTLRRVFEAVVRELKPRTMRDLWHVKVGKRIARPGVLDELESAVASGAPVRVRYRPSGKPPVDLVLVVTSVQRDLDPPHVLGYLLPGRGRRELRADRILSVSPP